MFKVTDSLDKSSTPKTTSRKKSGWGRVQFSVGTLLLLTVVAAIVVQQLNAPRTFVDSSYIRSVRHNAFTQTLTIEFNNEDIYQYADVPRSVYRDFLKAESHGRFFHQKIKGAKYAYEKID